MKPASDNGAASAANSEHAQRVRRIAHLEKRQRFSSAELERDCDVPSVAKLVRELTAPSTLKRVWAYIAARVRHFREVR